MMHKVLRIIENNGEKKIMLIERNSFENNNKKEYYIMKEYFVLSNHIRSAKNEIEKYLYLNQFPEIRIPQMKYHSISRLASIDRFKIRLYYEYFEAKDLFDYMKGNHTFLEVCDVFTQILEINYALYQKNIFHVDIKPENILIDLKTKKLYFIDFEFSIFSHQRLTKAVGTDEFMSPETFLQAKHYAKSAMYSIGMCIYDFIAMEDIPTFNSRLYLGLSLSEKYKIRYFTQIDILVKYPELLPLIKDMIGVNIKKRITTKRALAILSSIKSSYL